MTSGFVWIEPPAAMQGAIQQYGEKVVLAVKAVAEYFAQLIQDEARRGAPWHDRTGNARSGIFGATDLEGAAGDVIVIYLSHGFSIEYGKWLELAHGQMYAAIMPTLERNLPQLKTMLDDLFRD